MPLGHEAQLSSGNTHCTACPAQSSRRRCRCCRETIREKLIPHAVSWYTGEAIEQEEFGDEDDDEDDEEDDEDDDDEDDEDEDDEVGVVPDCALDASDHLPRCPDVQPVEITVPMPLSRSCSGIWWIWHHERLCIGSTCRRSLAAVRLLHMAVVLLCVHRMLRRLACSRSLH
jgi:hypothetical protein